MVNAVHCTLQCTPHQETMEFFVMFLFCIWYEIWREKKYVQHHVYQVFLSVKVSDGPSETFTDKNT